MFTIPLISLFIIVHNMVINSSEARGLKYVVQVLKLAIKCDLYLL